MIDRIYFKEGELVELKQSIPNKPVMFVYTVDKASIRSDDKATLLGITCLWFDDFKRPHRLRYSSKDLQHYHVTK